MKMVRALRAYSPQIGAVMFLAVAASSPALAESAAEVHTRTMERLEREGFRGIDKALESLESLVEEQGGYLPAHLSAAEAYLLKYEFAGNRDTLWLDRALQHVDAALALDENHPVARFRRAAVHFSMGREGAAETDLEKALEADPRYLDARILTLQHLLASGREKEAGEFADSSRQYYPGDPAPLKYFGDVFFQENSLEKAIEYYREVTSLVAQAPYTYLALGKAYQRREMYDQAVESYGQALEQNPDLTELHVDLSYCYGRLGRPGEAVAHLETYLRDNPRELSALNNAALLYEQAGSISKAQVAWLRLKEAAPDEHYRKRAETHLERLFGVREAALPPAPAEEDRSR